MESKIAGQLIRSPADYAELLEAYHRSDYADGIVVVPLTERRVSAAVAATGRSGATSIGSFDGRDQVSIRALAEVRSEETPSALQSLIRIPNAVFCLKKN